MIRTLCLAGYVLLLAICAPIVGHAQVATTAPAFPPQIFLFEAYDENLATITVSQTVVAEAIVTESRVNAAGVEEKTIVRVPEIREQQQKFLLAETKIRTVSGRELDRKEAAKLLKKKQPVILLTLSNKLPEAYKSLFRDEAIILEMKSLGTTPDLDGVIPEKK